MMSGFLLSFFNNSSSFLLKISSSVLYLICDGKKTQFLQFNFDKFLVTVIFTKITNFTNEKKKTQKNQMYSGISTSF